MFREYLRWPSRIPDEDMSLEQLVDDSTTQIPSLPQPQPPLPRSSTTSPPAPSSTAAPAAPTSNPTSPLTTPLPPLPTPLVPNLPPQGTPLSPTQYAQQLADAIKPFPNVSTYLLVRWFYDCNGTLSREDLVRLMQDVFRSPEFSQEEISKFSPEAMNAALDAIDKGRDSAPPAPDRWIEEVLRIKVPTGVKSGSRAKDSEASVEFEIPGFLRRSLVQVIIAACQSESAKDFHFDAFKSFAEKLDPETGEPVLIRIFDELFSTDAFLEAQEEIDNLPPEPGCDLPRSIAALMLWSDATHLTQFGQAKMWPIYLFFGNLSKWFRCKPDARSCHHVAHIPSVSHLSFVCCSYR